MCTTGAVILRPGHEYILFKNRDFSREHFDDQVHLSDRTFGVLGLETWDNDGRSEDKFSGFSIGFNPHLTCCDSNVRSIPGALNYDRLVQAVVEQCQSIEQALDCVRDMASRDRYSWANMVVATAEGLAAFEIRDHQVAVQYEDRSIARANHHVILGAHPQDDDTMTTAWRYETARDGVAASESLPDVFALLQQRHPDRSFGICNSGQYNTVYSYLIHRVGSAVDFYVLQGRPADGLDYTKIPIVLGADNDLSAYPSRHVSGSVVR